MDTNIDYDVLYKDTNINYNILHIDTNIDYNIRVVFRDTKMRNGKVVKFNSQHIIKSR